MAWFYRDVIKSPRASGDRIMCGMPWGVSRIDDTKAVADDLPWDDELNTLNERVTNCLLDDNIKPHEKIPSFGGIEYSFIVREKDVNAIAKLISFNSQRLMNGRPKSMSVIVKKIRHVHINCIGFVNIADICIF